MRHSVRVLVAEVWAEKDRRLAMGFDYDFGDERGVHHIGISETDMKGWNEVTTWAMAQLIMQNFAAWLIINTDTDQVAVTPVEWMQIINAATNYRDPIWQASFALEQMQPIPANYADDEWWQP